MVAPPAVTARISEKKKVSSLVASCVSRTRALTFENFYREQLLYAARDAQVCLWESDFFASILGLFYPYTRSLLTLLHSSQVLVRIYETLGPSLAEGSLINTLATH